MCISLIGLIKLHVKFQEVSFPTPPTTCNSEFGAQSYIHLKFINSNYDRSVSYGVDRQSDRSEENNEGIAIDRIANDRQYGAIDRRVRKT